MLIAPSFVATSLASFFATFLDSSIATFLASCFAMSFKPLYPTKAKIPIKIPIIVIRVYKVDKSYFTKLASTLLSLIL